MNFAYQNMKIIELNYFILQYFFKLNQDQDIHYSPCNIYKNEAMGCVARNHHRNERG